LVIKDFLYFLDVSGKSCDLKAVDAVSVTGQMHSFLIKLNNKPLTNIITWQDERCLERETKTNNYIYRFTKKYRKYFSKYQKFISTGYPATNLYYMLMNNQLPDSNFTIQFAPDFIMNYLLGKGEYMTDHSLAHSSGLYALEYKDWNWKLINSIGIKSLTFPKIVEPGTFIGKIGKHIKYLQGKPLFMGLGDNQASVFGAIENEQKDVVINIGTSGQVSTLLNRIDNYSPEIDYRPYPNEKILAVGASLAAGKTLEVLKSFIKDIGKKFFNVQASDEQIYKSIKDRVKQTSELHFNTTLNGTRFIPGERGSITNISLNNFYIDELITSATFGIVQELYEFYKHMDNQCERIIGVGNGLQKNMFFYPIIEKVFQKPFVQSKIQEAASYGAALCAFYGLKGL